MTDAAPIDHSRAVIDRIVDGTVAVLLVGPGEDELLVPAESLPEGASEGDWLILDETNQPVGIDEKMTAARRADIESRIDRMRMMRKGGRFER